MDRRCHTIHVLCVLIQLLTHLNQSTINTTNNYEPDQAIQYFGLGLLHLRLGRWLEAMIKKAVQAPFCWLILCLCHVATWCLSI